MINVPKDLLEFYVKLFDIPEHLAIRLTPLLTLKRLKKNQILSRPGDICTTGYLIIEGGLIMSHMNQNTNEEKVINFFLPTVQPFCGVTDSYFTGKKTKCKLFALDNTLVGYLKKEEFENTVKADDELLNYYLTKLNETLVFESNLRVRLITSTPDQFYHFLLTEHPEIIQLVPTKYIAQFMGISREWLSKIKSKKKVL